MANENISGPQKAAIFLYAIGEERASEIVKKLDEGEIKRLGGSMSKISAVPSRMVDSIFMEFNDLAGSGNRSISMDPAGGNKYIRNILARGVQGGKANALLEEIEEQGKWNLFQKVKQIEPKTFGNFIKGEHPQTIAIILAHLGSTTSAAVMASLPAPLQADVICRIAELDDVPRGILEDIDQSLQEETSLQVNEEGRTVGGVRSVAEILNQMDTATEGAILKGIEEQKQGLADEIRKFMFVFEDLSQVEDRGIMAILKEVSNEVLALAMKTGSEGLKTKVFKNMSERAAQMMKEDLEVMGPVRLKDVESAQQSIIKIAKKLEGEGKIVLSGKGTEDVFV